MDGHYNQEKIMFKNRTVSGIAICILLFASTLWSQEWVDLFDGKSLKGWSVHSGFATYEVEEGMIVGTTAKNSPNTFLCTDKEYDDFILEFEVMLDDPELNSGVQFRSHIAPQEMVLIFRDNNGKPKTWTLDKDRLYGYQVEISAQENGTSGGVYDEARRRFFLDNVSNDAKASKAFKDGEWNQYRVECRESSIKTFINGIPCADFKDSMSSKGVIGLQVHGVGVRGPYSVRWRNIRLKEID